MSISISGSTGISGVDGSASTPAIQGSDTNTGISFGTDTVNINTGGTTRATVDSSGRFGVGAASPGERLHVYDSSVATTRAIVGANGTGAATPLALALEYDTTGNTLATVRNIYNNASAELRLGGYGFITFTSGSSQTERARIDSSGRLLIGTNTVPGSDSTYSRVNITGNAYGGNAPGELSLLTATSAASVNYNGSQIGVIRFGDVNGNPFARIECIADAATSAGDFPGRLVFYTTADGASSVTERMRITNEGYFKASNTGSYNNTSYYHELRTNNNNWWIATVSHTTASNPYGIAIQYTAAAPNNTSNHFLECSDNSTTRVNIRSNGGLANYQANNVNLSDINSKKDISPAANTWDCIKEWEIVNYRYKDQPDDADLNLGVIAQQVAVSCPEVVTVFEESKDDQPEKLGIKEQQMYWMAIKALQEAMERIESLEARLTTLEGGAS